MQGKLRFAPLIRVSTETQAKRGESLNTQKSQITQAVEFLGGAIPDSCWQYAGQESATSDLERVLLDKLLEDSAKGIFDAIIVQDVSRWSRNNLKSEQGLEILRKNGIRFFDLTTEVDLFDPDQLIILQLKVNIHSYSALQNAKKSILNKISLLEKGTPAFTLPYGRVYDKETKIIELDTEKQARIEKCCRDYLAGKHWTTLAQELGMGVANMYTIFREKLGDEITVSIKSKKFPIEKKIKFKIPRLVSPEIEKAVKEKIRLNRRMDLKKKSNKYLLKSLVHCMECGKVLMGHTVFGPKGQEYTYYRHPTIDNDCKGFAYAPGEALEKAVISDMFTMFGDRPRIEKAIQKANLKSGDYGKLERDVNRLEKELGKVEQGIQRVVKAIVAGTISEVDSKREMDDLKDRREILTIELENAKTTMNDIPSPEEISSLALQVEKSFLTTDAHLEEMSQDEKRLLLESLFMHRKAYREDSVGVFVEKGKSAGWYYEIRGTIFPELNGLFTKDEHLGNYNFPESVG